MRTEAEIAALRPLITEYPEREVVRPLYPPIRRKRGLQLSEQAGIGDDAPGALPSGGLTGGPIARLWSVSLYSSSVGVSIQRSSPSFVGPGLLHSFTGIIRAQSQGSGIHPTQIAYSATPFPNTNVGASFPKLTGTHIVFNSNPYANAAAQALFDEGFLPDQNTQLARIPLGVYIPLDRFYIGLLLQGGALGQAAIVGTFRIIENAPPESISWA